MDLKQLLSQTTVGAEESVIETDEGVPKPSVEPAELGSDGEGVVQEHEGRQGSASTPVATLRPTEPDVHPPIGHQVLLR